MEPTIFKIYVLIISTNETLPKSLNKIKFKFSRKWTGALKVLLYSRRFEPFLTLPQGL